MIVLELALAPALVGAATLAARRWGDGVAGVVSAFPVIVGPALLITAREHGAGFAATAAEATLLGLLSLAAFLLVYGRLAAGGRGWVACFGLAWLAAGAIGLALSGVEPRSPAGLVAAALSLAVAHRALPRQPAQAARPGGPLLVRMLVTGVLVAAVAVAAAHLGPVAGGVVAALPILASVLAVATHRRDGAAAAVALLRGMAAGMAGFVAFCQVVALSGTPVAFAAATGAAVAAQAVALVAVRPTIATASWGVPSVWRRWTYRSRASSRPSASNSPR